VPGTHHRQVARRIAKATFVLLEGRVVLLVDHDQPELRHRGEHHRARAEHDARAAAEGVAPGEQALVIRQGECSTPSGRRSAHQSGPAVAG